MSRITNIRPLVTSIDSKKLECMRVQSLTKKPPPSASARSRTVCGARSGSASASRNPVTSSPMR